jgi:hypothetical protein
VTGRTAVRIAFALMVLVAAAAASQLADIPGAFAVCVMLAVAALVALVAAPLQAGFAEADFVVLDLAGGLPGVLDDGLHLAGEGLDGHDEAGKPGDRRAPAAAADDQPGQFEPRGNVHDSS